jgi:hypothetical protein
MKERGAEADFAHVNKKVKKMVNPYHGGSRYAFDSFHFGNGVGAGLLNFDRKRLCSRQHKLGSQFFQSCTFAW